MEYPYKQYELDTLLNEFLKLKKCQNANSKLGYKCSDYFFQITRMNTSTFSHLTNIEYWNKNYMKVISYTEKYFNIIIDKDNKNHIHKLSFVLDYLNHPPSQFPPCKAMYIYREFNATCVLDPFAGWGNRMIAAMAMDIDYIGIDLNDKLIKSYHEMIDFYKEHTKSNIQFIHANCKDIILNLTSPIINNVYFDFIFSSPPFFSKGKLIDKYHNTLEDEDYFYTNILNPIIEKCIQLVKYTCFYLPPDMIEKLNTKPISSIEWNGRGNKKNQRYIVYVFGR
jgi:DNA modification methylase